MGLMIVGFEGVWGTLECIFVLFPLLKMLPGNDNGSFEDTIDTLTMVGNSTSLQGLILLYIFSCSTFNVSSIFVTKSFNSVHRTMLEGTRTSVIWLWGLVVFYQIDKSAAYGEKWHPFSWMELVGFAFLIFGQSVYGEVLKLKCFS